MFELHGTFWFQSICLKMMTDGRRMMESFVYSHGSGKLKCAVMIATITESRTMLVSNAEKSSKEGQLF